MGLVDKRSPQPTTPSSAPAQHLSVVRMRPPLYTLAQDTVGVRPPPNT